MRKTSAWSRAGHSTKASVKKQRKRGFIPRVIIREGNEVKAEPQRAAGILPAEGIRGRIHGTSRVPWDWRLESRQNPQTGMSAPHLNAFAVGSYQRNLLQTRFLLLGLSLCKKVPVLAQRLSAPNLHTSRTP